MKELHERFACEVGRANEPCVELVLIALIPNSSCLLRALHIW